MSSSGASLPACHPASTSQATATLRARAEIEIRRRARAERERLVDFIPRLTRRFTRPAHLGPLLELFERFRAGERVRAVVSTPPRHGKTEALVHGIAYLLGHRPSLQIAYVSYASRFAEDKSRKARQLAGDADVPISRTAWSRQNWRTGVEDGGVWATAIAGQITGQGFHLMIVDDPVKDRAAAESPVQRAHHYEWFTDTAYTRLEPNGSCIVNMARWHEDDLAGRLVRDGWEHINLRALDDDGRALWPERFSAERLADIRATLGEYGWASLYQGEPRPRGGAVFRDVHYYDVAPKAYRVSVGIDLAYTAKTHSDWCAAVVLAESGGCYYVLDVRHAQTTPPEFAAELRELAASYPGSKWFWYCSTTEQGLAQFLKSECGFPVSYAIAKADKFTRAQPAAAAWNAEKILVPRAAPWVPDFVHEVCSFTGLGDAHDDQVDALAAAFDIISPMRAGAVRYVYEAPPPGGGFAFR